MDLKFTTDIAKKSAERAPERTLAALMALFMDRESTLNEVRTVSQPIYEVFFRVRSARWFFTMVQTKEHGAVARNNILWLKQGKNNGLNIELKGQIRACRNGTLIKLLWHGDRWGCFRKKDTFYMYNSVFVGQWFCVLSLSIYFVSPIESSKSLLKLSAQSSFPALKYCSKCYRSSHLCIIAPVSLISSIDWEST